LRYFSGICYFMFLKDISFLYLV